MGRRAFDDSIREELLERLATGEFLISIARDPRMPNVRTIKRWASANDEFAEEMREAREIGFEVETERLAEEVRTCEDPQRARVLYEVLRYRAGKLSQVFRDRPLVGLQVNVGDETAFAAFAGALEEARAARASLSHSTAAVALSSPPGPDHAAGQLADMAGAGGTGLGEDADGR